jgi:hypothetical protein
LGCVEDNNDDDEITMEIRGHNPQIPSDKRRSPPQGEGHTDVDDDDDDVEEISMIDLDEEADGDAEMGKFRHVVGLS